MMGGSGLGSPSEMVIAYSEQNSMLACASRLQLPTCHLAAWHSAQVCSLHCTGR